MKMTNWRLGFYCFSLVALGLASNAVNTFPTTQSIKSPVYRTVASTTKLAIDRMAEEEVLIMTPQGMIYKRTRYVESIRLQVSDNKKLLEKIKRKDALIKEKIAEVQKLKREQKIADHIILAALDEIELLGEEKAALDKSLAEAKALHAKEKLKLEQDIASLQESLSSETDAKASEIKLKEEALAELQSTKLQFTALNEELEVTNSELTIAEDEISDLEIQLADLSDELDGKNTKIQEQEVKITEQDTKLKDQETQITEQGAHLAELRLAECEQQKQLKELKKQLDTFEAEKKEMDDVVAALKKEKEETEAEREEEKKEIEALLQQFTMYATLMSQTPQVQVPQVLHNPLTDSSLVDWNKYMSLAMLGRMSSQTGMDPFGFNGGNSQVNSYYFMPEQATDAFLYHSALNPKGTSWGEIGPNNYFGGLGQGFDFSAPTSHLRPLEMGRDPAFFGF